MKRCLSVFGLFLKQSLSEVLALSTVLLIVQGYHFWGICSEGPEELHSALINYDLNHAFIFNFALLTVYLAKIGCDRSGKSVYTYNRLQISQKHIYLIQAACNLLAYWFFFTVQMILMLVFAVIYSRIHPDYIGPMSLVQAIYRTPLFRLVLPLQDVFTWLGNVVTLTALSLCVAVFPLRSRYGKVSISAILMGLLAVFYLYLQIYENTYFDISGSVISMIGSVCLVACAAGGVWATEEEYDE